MAEALFDVFGHRDAVRREGAQWRAWAIGNDGKRAPAGFVIPDFIADDELPQFLFDHFHESARPGSDVRRIG